MGGLAAEAGPLAGPVSAPHEGGPTQLEALGGGSTQHRAQHMAGGQYKLAALGWADGWEVSSLGQTHPVGPQPSVGTCQRLPTAEVASRLGASLETLFHCLTDSLSV